MSIKKNVQVLNKEKEELTKDLEAAKTLKGNAEKSFLEAKQESKERLNQLNEAQKQSKERLNQLNDIKRELNNTKKQLNQKEESLKKTDEEKKALEACYRRLVHLCALSQVLQSNQNENNEDENNKTKNTKPIFYKDQEKAVEEFNKKNKNNNLQKQLSDFIQKTGLNELNFQAGIEQLKNLSQEVVPIQIGN